MALMDRLKPYYEAGMICDNCGKKCSIRIKKGTAVEEAIKNKEIKCDSCGCLIEPKEYTTQWIK